MQKFAIVLFDIKILILVFKYSRKDLEDKNSFALEWIGIKNFLDHLPKPLCIIAHNGSK